jgi:hypothetical protein
MDHAVGEVVGVLHVVLENMAVDDLANGRDGVVVKD